MTTRRHTLKTIAPVTKRRHTKKPSFPMIEIPIRTHSHPRTVAPVAAIVLMTVFVIGGAYLYGQPDVSGLVCQFADCTDTMGMFHLLVWMSTFPFVALFVMAGVFLQEITSRKLSPKEHEVVKDGVKVFAVAGPLVATVFALGYSSGQPVGADASMYLLPEFIALAFLASSFSFLAFYSLRLIQLHHRDHRRRRDQESEVFGLL